MSKNLFATAAAAACGVDDFTLNNIFKHREKKFKNFFQPDGGREKNYIRKKKGKLFGSVLILSVAS